MPAPTLTRTPEEIVAEAERVRESPTEDFFGARYANLVLALPLEQARPFFNRDADVSDYKPEDPYKAAVEYMNFATGKATDHRGLSAGRSVDHYRAWMWLLGLDDQVDWENYAQYGAPILKQCADLLAAPWPDDDEGLNRMANGEPCSDECLDGCEA